MTGGWSPERRRDERREVPFPLYAHVIGLAGDAAEASLGVRVSGVSVGGLVLESSTHLSVGRRVSLTLAGPDGEIGPIEGRVVHSRLVLAPRADTPPSYVVGIAFDSPASATSNAIEALLFSVDRRVAPDDPSHAP